VRCSVVLCAEVCCSVLHFVAVCYSVLQCVAVTQQGADRHYLGVHACIFVCVHPLSCLD